MLQCISSSAYDFFSTFMSRRNSTIGDAFESIQEQLAKYKSLLPIRSRVHPDDDIMDSNIHYLSTGENAVEIIFEAMLLCRVTTLNSILDMPSGFGRVARHLKAAFPTAILYA